MKLSELPDTSTLTTMATNKARTECQQCLRALCICHLSQMQSNRLRLLIWQHPDEARHVKGSARLLHLCLKNSHILVAKSVSAEDLAKACEVDNLQSAALLYPSAAVGEFKAAQLATAAAINCLVLIDASWRDSRKILRDNPYLLDLPRYSLRHDYPGRYQIRKAHKPGQLSSMEAGLYALQELAPGDIAYQALFQVFEAFNQLQGAYFQRKGE